ncbi:hypothetical protein [Pseudomonas sp. OA65]|uniref:hypothetical protein n=1 Tax=Pseudomonas sp. OA65 TaxID=2818431 RepID=UPI001A9DB65D|nr:hypothetical protein [Pseudomonas sp. OA65]MBO1541911.1 hypothetical protein [Pseudomonas sp. OA65]
MSDIHSGSRNLPKPIVSVLLPDSADWDETGLLPANLANRPLRVQIPPWEDSAVDGHTSYLRVYWNNGSPVHERAWTASEWGVGNRPPPADLLFDLDARHVQHGVHELKYEVTMFSANLPVTEPLTVTIDEIPPLLGNDSSLIIDTGRVTEQYLFDNDDKVRAEVPAYLRDAPGDIITWYWNKNPLNVVPADEVASRTLYRYENGQPLPLDFAGDMIRARGDGDFFAFYRLQDRAGNFSPYSAPYPLKVDVTPVPRVLPPVSVKQATNGPSGGVLDPLKATYGVTVTIPPQAIIHDGEGVFVQWAEPGTVGAHRTDTPNPAGSRDYKIPSDKIAQHLGKTISVQYEVFEPGVVEPHKSNNYSLRVDELSGLPTIQCDKVSGGGLSLGSIDDGDYAKFTLERWTFMAVDQFLTVEVRGVDSGNQQVIVPVLTEYPVPEVAQRISAGQISKTDLQRFKIGSPLEVRVSMSFDAKQTWKDFPRLTPILVA